MIMMDFFDHILLLNVVVFVSQVGFFSLLM